MTTNVPAAPAIDDFLKRAGAPPQRGDLVVHDGWVFQWRPRSSVAGGSQGAFTPIGPLEDPSLEDHSVGPEGMTTLEIRDDVQFYGRPEDLAVYLTMIVHCCDRELAQSVAETLLELGRSVPGMASGQPVLVCVKGLNEYRADDGADVERQLRSGSTRLTFTTTDKGRRLLQSVPLNGYVSVTPISPRQSGSTAAED